MNVTFKTDSSVYLDEDGHIVAECYFDSSVSEDPVMVAIHAFSQLVKETAELLGDEDGIVRNSEALDIMYNIASELKDALDLLHNHIDDGVYLDED
jgi:ubiquinone biosynthesis protein UbiJ